jgi:tripartite-type tricarboxylate transporter receptor subunit TctC
MMVAAHIRAGKLRPLTVAGAAPPCFPGAAPPRPASPFESGTWSGFAAPAGTPAAVISG